MISPSPIFSAINGNALLCGRLMDGVVTKIFGFWTTATVGSRQDGAPKHRESEAG